MFECAPGAKHKTQNMPFFFYCLRIHPEDQKKDTTRPHRRPTILVVNESGRELRHHTEYLDLKSRKEFLMILSRMFQCLSIHQGSISVIDPINSFACRSFHSK